MRKWLLGKLGKFIEGFIMGTIYSISVVLIFILVMELVK